MAVRKIVTIPNEILFTKAEKVKNIDAEVEEVAKDLLDTVKVAKDPEGAGLAAPQIGVSTRMCVVRNFVEDPTNPEKISSEDFVLINPKIKAKSKETDVDWEGCLSVPDKYGKVERFKKIKVAATLIDGSEVEIKASGFFARTIQHEVDHLDGILFTSKVVGKTIPEAELDKLSEGKDEE